MAKSLSVAALSVLHAVASGTAHGFDIIDTTGLPGGTVYPALTRMERDGLLTSDWEDVEVARADGRPPRRNYRARAIVSARRPAVGARDFNVFPIGGEQAVALHARQRWIHSAARQSGRVDDVEAVRRARRHRVKHGQ